MGRTILGHFVHGRTELVDKFLVSITVGAGFKK
jgi:hypothetical protein